MTAVKNLSVYLLELAANLNSLPISGLQKVAKDPRQPKVQKS